MGQGQFQVARRVRSDFSARSGPTEYSELRGLEGLALHTRRTVKRRAQSFCKFHRVIIGPEMHEVQAWLFIKHVAVKGRYLDAVLAQRLEDRVHLLSSQNKVSGNRGFSAAGRLKIDS